MGTNQTAYKIGWDKKHTKMFHLKLNLSTDKDIIDKLKSTGNMQGYIKELIRRDIKSAE